MGRGGLHCFGLWLPLSSLRPAEVEMSCPRVAPEPLSAWLPGSSCQAPVGSRLASRAWVPWLTVHEGPGGSSYFSCTNVLSLSVYHPARPRTTPKTNRCMDLCQSPPLESSRMHTPLLLVLAHLPDLLISKPASQTSLLSCSSVTVAPSRECKKGQDFFLFRPLNAACHSTDPLVQHNCVGERSFPSFPDMLDLEELFKCFFCV